MNWRDTLADALRGVESEAVCAQDAGGLQVAGELFPEAPLKLCDTPPSNAQVQLALVKEALHGLDATQARTLLARVRDFIAPRIIVIADAHCALTRLDFLALGFETLAVDEAEKVTLYQFDLATYKQVPDWLNARFWANPERWKP